MREITYTEALLEAFREEMRRDEKVFHLCGGLGPLERLIPEFGRERVRVCPISEEAYVGASIGAAGGGFRPIVSPGMMTFAFTAMDQIVNQMAKIHYMFGGQATFPIVFRAGTGGGRSAAAQHSQSPHPMFMNLAGLKLIMPSNPYDGKGLMKSAIRDNNPVVFFEDQLLDLGGVTGPVPEEEYTIPIGVADVKRQGSDITVVAISKMVREALVAAGELEGEGVSVEVVDPRTLVPLDREAIRASVQKTGRVVVVDEACITCSAAAEIATVVSEDPATFRALKAPPKRVCAPDVPIPYSPVMERFCIPDKADIIRAVKEVLA
ncbi:MAG: alpha-ketoacid dehydrogenase subunit beta [Rhodospirillaceae bacterium]|jgi:pyruvate dehydrogenase E1 component beta subunit|nr:alpha-ketoacid dehydrogenase subunit beta [Rhodospirillaceae bacterium]